eukprot:CAMPEP_0184868110 /NCGR_PEP_ID=MMETSP0580-20130426/29187_1 /TAXON_ID=1118495 /ORGANISM="Dactyliosolen fragilissimus" /LENGTH=984 /DNA_ID=CAMNT_0027368775 /DNA_START=14 /DNA_END=2968 /DNA_ORIENTATION=-
MATDESVHTSNTEYFDTMEEESAMETLSQSSGLSIGGSDSDSDSDLSLDDEDVVDFAKDEEEIERAEERANQGIGANSKETVQEEEGESRSEEVSQVSNAKQEDMKDFEVNKDKSIIVDEETKTKVGTTDKETSKLNRDEQNKCSEKTKGKVVQEEVKAKMEGIEMENPSEKLLEKSTTHLIVNILGADIKYNFERFGGKMDPYAELKWIKREHGEGEGKPMQILGRTQTLWNAHDKPEWNYKCKSRIYDPKEDSEDLIQIEVFEDNIVTSTIIGVASVSVSDILPYVDNERQKYASSTIKGPICEFPLKKTKDNRERETGTVSIQVSLVEVLSNELASTGGFPGDHGHEQALISFTKVQPDVFHKPVERIGVSGGTAPFFKLKLKDEHKLPLQSSSHYIGKDLSRATDEVAFYEDLLSLQRPSHSQGFSPLFPFLFEYKGVFTAPEAKEALNETLEDQEQLDLLVMRNLYDGKKKLRLLDIKMGEKTASANWQGKSRIRAMKQGIVDGWTNSTREGFRLEGFDGRPLTLDSMNPLSDFNIKETESNGETMIDRVKTCGKTDKSGWNKKAFRFMLQNMKGSEILMHLLDMHQYKALQSALEGNNENNQMSSSEYTEIVLHEIVHKLSKLAIACRQIPVPQKWIGSSVAIGFDCGELPQRSYPTKSNNNTDTQVPQSCPTLLEEENARKNVIVSIFDWGRSELNTIEKNEMMTDLERDDRQRYWRYYTTGIDRLSFEAVTLYRNRFCVSGSGACKHESDALASHHWNNITLELRDFDSLTNDDVVGRITVPLEEVSKKKDVFVMKSLLWKLRSNSGNPTITYSLTYVKFPSKRLKGSWRITIHSASRVPSMDPQVNILGAPKNDPYVMVIANASNSGLQVINERRSCRPHRIKSLRKKPRSFSQMTSVRSNTGDPTWEETFEIPVAQQDNDEALWDVLKISQSDEVGMHFQKKMLSSKFKKMPSSFSFDDRFVLKKWRKELNFKN